MTVKSLRGPVGDRDGPALLNHAHMKGRFRMVVTASMAPNAEPGCGRRAVVARVQ